MRFITTEIPGMVVVEPDIYRDARGYFLETFNTQKYSPAGIPEVFCQDNYSCSVRNTLRGLHLQVHKPQGKLIRVVEGEIWDVAVDLRWTLPTFGRWAAVRLSADNFLQLYIPPGCAHGFCVLSDTAKVEYKCTELYDPGDELGIAYDDPDLAIDWPVAEPILSVRDAQHRRLKDVLPELRAALTSPVSPTARAGGERRVHPNSDH